MKLKLMRPLCSIDFESTVTDQNPNKPNPELDRIVEIGIKRFSLDDEKVFSARVNPGITIHPNSTAVHGITDKDVAGCPTFGKIAADVLKFIAGADIVGYNVLRYDAPLLNAELLRAGMQWDYSKTKFVDALSIAREKEPRNLTWAMQFYCGKDHEAEAHGAMADATAALNVMLAQVEKYEDIPVDIDGLAKYSNGGSELLDLSGKFKYDNGEIVFAFGKHNGERAQDRPDYLNWMLGADFPRDTKAVARKILKG